MAKNTEAAAPTACECSRYDALVPEQLTEAALESGEYDAFDTGCSATTTRTFAPGHDAKLKSFLIRHGALGHDIRRNEGGVAVSAEALDHAKRYDFAHMVAAGLKKAAEKAAARATRAAGKPRKQDEAGGTTHRSLADIVASEEAEHAAQVAANQPTPEWDDEPEGQLMRNTRAWVGGARIAGEIRQIDGQAWFVYEGKNGRTRTREYDEGSDAPAKAETVDLTGLPEVVAKVGRWEYKGIEKDGTFYYLAKDGQTRKTAAKYEVLRGA